jgi:hypothetical protein
MKAAKPRRHVKAKYRSGLEDQVAAFLKPIQKEVRYEKISIEWEDLMYRSYTPDFVLDNGVIIEAKGLFDSEDRRKHLAVKKQHPELDIRFVFSSAKSKLYKGSKTCYSDWCNKYGFKWANRIIPELWLKEKGTAPITTDIKLKTPKKEKL